jgi:hypothetical protein
MTVAQLSVSIHVMFMSCNLHRSLQINLIPRWGNMDDDDDSPLHSFHENSFILRQRYCLLNCRFRNHNFLLRESGTTILNP